MRHARRYLETLTNTKIEPRTLDLQNRLPAEDVKDLARFRMKMATLAVSRGHTLLYDAQFRPIEQVPPLARRTPLVTFARSYINYSKHDASECGA
jgi:hypothetical protein